MYTTTREVRLLDYCFLSIFELLEGLQEGSGKSDVSGEVGMARSGSYGPRQGPPSSVGGFCTGVCVYVCVRVCACTYVCVCT